MEQPNYYAILPAKVRYDKDLSSTAKLMYAEITSLCNKEGYCWATNQYFAQLYDVTERQIIRIIKLLQKKKYVTVQNPKSNVRYIFLCEVSDINVMQGVTFMSGVGDIYVKNQQVRNRLVNNKYNNKKNNNKAKAVDKYREVGTNPLYREYCSLGEKVSFREWVDGATHD